MVATAAATTWRSSTEATLQLAFNLSKAPTESKKLVPGLSFQSHCHFIAHICKSRSYIWNSGRTPIQNQIPICFPWLKFLIR
jgi:hypothetical protein